MNEFSTIRKIIEKAADSAAKNAKLLVPPGDDAALLCPLQHPVVSTDTQREGIHFSLNWQTPAEIGYKAIMTAASDLAASYASPIACFINLALPKKMETSIPEELYTGINEALKQINCKLGGGNISNADILGIDLFVIGEGSKIFPKRSCALPGDNLYVSRQLGHARAGLELLQNACYEFPGLIKAFKKPEADFESGEYLKKAGVKCVMDISDGLAGDALHIAKASNITIEFEIDEKNCSGDFKEYCIKYNKSLKNEILSGGEDYCLLFSCKEHLYQSELKNNLPESFKVGRCIPFGGKHLANIPENINSFQHT